LDRVGCAKELPAKNARSQTGQGAVCTSRKPWLEFPSTKDASVIKLGDALYFESG